MKHKYYNKDLNDAYNDGYTTAQREFLEEIKKLEKDIKGEYKDCSKTWLLEELKQYLENKHE